VYTSRWEHFKRLMFLKDSITRRKRQDITSEPFIDNQCSRESNDQDHTNMHGSQQALYKQIAEDIDNKMEMEMYVLCDTYQQESTGPSYQSSSSSSLRYDSDSSVPSTAGTASSPPSSGLPTLLQDTPSKSKRIKTEFDSSVAQIECANNMHMLAASVPVSSSTQMSASRDEATLLGEMVALRTRKLTYINFMKAQREILNVIDTLLLQQMDMTGNESY